ncbi:MAG: hypothetical protein R3B70_24065 [Polyangiaceae bacterium]
MQTSFARHRAALLAGLAFTAALVACGPPTEPVGPYPGKSTRPAGGPTVAPPPTALPPARWSRWDELATFRVAIPRAPSQHLAADHDAETLASPEAPAYPQLGPARTPAPGAALVQRLYAPEGTTPELYFVMSRTPVAPAPSADAPAPLADASAASSAPAPTWDFAILDAAGFVTESGSIPACARCHAEAPHDGLFGRAR